MKFLVTGGAGFIGNTLVRHLLACGHRVHVLDNFSTGNKANLREFGTHPKFSWSAADVRSFGRGKGLWNQHTDGGAIYHLACPASPKAYQADPIGTLMTAVEGTRNMLEIAKAWNRPILIASTSEVYGDPAQHPQREDHWGNVNPVGVRSCYDEGKRAAEALAMDYARVHGVRVRIARIFNTYGPFMAPDDGRVVSNFITQALRGEGLTVYGDGSQTRSLCYMDDTVTGLVRLMESDLEGPVNIGNPQEVTILELAKTVIHLTGSCSQVAFRTLPQDDPCRRCPDITKARGMGWEPSVGLLEGLGRTVAYFAGTMGMERAAE